MYKVFFPLLMIEIFIPQLKAQSDKEFKIGLNSSVDLNRFSIRSHSDYTVSSTSGIRAIINPNIEKKLEVVIDISYSKKQNSFNYNHYPNLLRKQDNTTTQEEASDSIHFSSYNSKYAGQLILFEPALNYNLKKSEKLNWTAGLGLLMIFNISENYRGSYYRGYYGQPDSIIDEDPIPFSYEGGLDKNLNETNSPKIARIGFTTNTEIRWTQGKYTVFLQGNLKLSANSENGYNPFFIAKRNFTSASLKLGIDYQI